MNRNIDNIDTQRWNDVDNYLSYNAPSRRAYNVTHTESIKPVVQNYNPYGIINDQLFRIFTTGGGAVTSSNSELDISIGTTLNAFAIARSTRIIKYRPGYSCIIRANGVFDSNAVDGSLQFLGAGTSSNDIYFCMTGGRFGVRISTGGREETYNLEVTTAASGSENATVTLNSIAYTVPLTNAGGSTAFTAFEIAKFVYGVWNSQNISSNVVFQAAGVGPRSGNYSFSSATAAATFSQLKSGNALSTTFVPQNAWNGSCPIKYQINPFLRNMYEIEYSWYGSGNIDFNVYNSETSRYETVHRLEYSNNTTELSLTNPNMYIQRGVASLSSTTALSLKTAGNFAGIFGNVSRIEPRGGVSVEKSISSGTETAILALRTAQSINGIAVQSEILIDTLNVTNEGIKSCVFKIYRNPASLGNNTTSNYTNWTRPNSQSIALFASNFTTFTNGILIASVSTGKESGVEKTFLNSEIYIGRDDVLLITAKSSGNADVSANIGFIEDL